MPESSDEAELLDLLCLTMVPGVGPATFQALMERFGSAGRALSASEGRLKEVAGVGPKLDAMTRDKKNRGGKVRFVLPRMMGQVELTDVASLEDVRAVLPA